MAAGTSTRYFQLSEIVAGVKLKQDQHQRAMEIRTQQLTQLSEAVKEIRSILRTKPTNSNNKEESTMTNGGMGSFPKQIRLEFSRFDGEDPIGWKATQ